MSYISENFNNKRILIWGYGREGRSTEAFLGKHCEPLVIDVFEGKREDIDESAYDHIIKSPGIVMKDDDPRYTSQTQIFLDCFRDRTVGITGTKGKSTTSSMMAKVLSDCTGRNVRLLGNIGLPCLDYYDEIADDEDSIVVFEMSCHQLAHVTVSPHIAIFLNLYEEHLDYYETMDAYFHAKSNIARYQGADDRLYVGSNVPAVATKAVVYTVEEDIHRDPSGEPLFKLKIPGDHNCINAEFVYRVAHDVYGADDESIRRSLSEYEGLPHRLQYVGTRNGIRYYDDSISTIPQATIAALNALPETDTVIIGGMDRGIDYDELIGYVRKHDEFRYIFSYETGRRIMNELKGLKYCYYTEDLKSAVELASGITGQDRICLLSPAAASYGYFKNFEHRGDMFKEYALGLST